MTATWYDRSGLLPDHWIGLGGGASLFALHYGVTGKGATNGVLTYTDLWDKSWEVRLMASMPI
jgi:hypothetical protein